MTSRIRATVVALLLVAVALRISASQPLSAVMGRIASDPAATVRHAADGWTTAGTLGGASAQGLRDLPLALFCWLGSQLGASAQLLQASWRALVLLIALLGAVRLARALAPTAQAGSWTPWVAAILFSSGPVLVPVLVRSPLDGLAAATLPWIVSPLLTGRPGWRQAAASAAWLGLAGVASPAWATAALVAGVAAAATRGRAGVGPMLRWLALAALASSWWVAAFVWELLHADDVAALAGAEGLPAAVTETLGRHGLAGFLVALGLVGTLLVAVSALVLRPPGTDVRFVAGLCGAVVVVGALVLVGWEPPLVATPGDDPPGTVVGPLLGLLGLAALVAWTPLVGQLRDRIRLDRSGRLPSGGRGMTAAVLGAALVLTGTAGLVAAGAEPEVVEGAGPALATQVAEWSAQAPPGRVLVVPARTDDQVPSLGAALGERPWIGRDSLPTSGAAATSALDDLLVRLTRGDGGPGTASALRRLGIAHVLLHLDGSVPADRATPAALVRSALETEGARRVASLSDRTGDETGSKRLLDFGVRSTTDQVEIWSLPDSSGGWLHPGAPVDVVGDPGTTSDLADAGVLGSRALRLRSTTTARVGVLSDSARRRDVDQRVPVDPYGPTLGAGVPRSVVPPEAAPVTTATRRVTGARSVTTSSSAADLGGQQRQAGTDAMAAVDGNVFTAWQSRRGTGTGQWWQVEFTSSTSLAGASVQLIRNLFVGQAVTRVRVSTDEGSEEYAVAADGLVALEGAEQSTRLRITVIGVKGTTGPGDSVGIAEVTIPGVSVRDELAVSGPSADAWVMAARPGSHAHCVPSVPTRATAADPASAGTACDPGLEVDGPETGSVDRVLDVHDPTVVTGRAWVRAAGTPQSAALAQQLARPTVVASGSSVAAQDLVTRPQAAVDADDSTAWRPAPEDAAPTLTLTWRRTAGLSGLRLGLPDPTLASVPTRVRVAAVVRGRGTVTAEAPVGADGSVTIPRVRTRSVAITFLEDSGLKSTGTLTGGVRHVPIAIAEVGLVGGPDVAFGRDAVRDLGCGSGPPVTIGDKELQTAVRTTAGDIVAGAVIHADLCTRAALPAGQVTVAVPSSFTWVPLGIVLSGPEGSLAGVGGAKADSSSGSATPVPATLLGRLGAGRTDVRLEGASAGRTFALAVPSGTGWTARSASGSLRPLTVDGWSQAWGVPAGVDRVELRYSPGGTLRGWAGAGAAAWALVVLLAAFGAAATGRRRWDHRMAGSSTQA